MAESKSIVLFESADKEVQLDVQLDGETVWLSQGQMAALFDTTKQNISLHANNCFREGELTRNAVVKESLITASDGKRYKTQLYNLDVVISVGYRVKSQRGVEFRRWATDVLRRYIIDGHAENEKDDSFKGSIGNIYQSFGGQDIYPSLQEKAANLLYFVVKNHSFLDGNKRIAATMFLYFLDRNGALFADDDRKLIDDSTLVAITIMIAESKPEEKDAMVALVMNFLTIGYEK